jgi:transposase
VLKDTRYIWLKNPVNLTEKQQVKLSQLEKMNLKINRAYLLKETFSQLWTYRTKG